MGTQRIIGTPALEAYAIAAAPDSRTASLIVRDTTAPAQGVFPLNLVRLDLDTSAVMSTVPLRDQAGSRIYSPSWYSWAPIMVDTGRELVLLNYDSSSPAATTIRFFSQDGVLSRQVSASGAFQFVISPDNTTAYLASDSKAQRMDLATGTVLAEYAGYSRVFGLALGADARTLYTIGKVGSGQDATVIAWSTTSNTQIASWAAHWTVEVIGAVPGMRQPPPPQSGWWWDPTRSGSGYAVEVQAGGKTYVGTFTYEADGRPAWFVTYCVLTISNICSGSLEKYTGGTTVDGAYQAPTFVGSAGPATLSFSAPDRATLTLPGGQTSLVRFPIDQAAGINAAPDWAPQKGWWWAPSESGTGWFIEAQNTVSAVGTTFTNMFLVGYMYGADGQPVWYMSNGLYNQVATAGGPLPTYQGILSEFANGPPYTGGTGSGTTMTGQRGTITMQFTSANAATLTLPNGRSLPLSRFVLQ